MSAAGLSGREPTAPRWHPSGMAERSTSKDEVSGRPSPRITVRTKSSARAGRESAVRLGLERLSASEVGFGSRAVKLPVGICFRMPSESGHRSSGFSGSAEPLVLPKTRSESEPCSVGAQQRHKIIRNGVALAGEESVSVGHRRHPPPGRSGEPTHAHLHHRK